MLPGNLVHNRLQCDAPCPSRRRSWRSHQDPRRLIALLSSARIMLWMQTACVSAEVGGRIRWSCTDRWAREWKWPPAAGRLKKREEWNELQKRSREKRDFSRNAPFGRAQLGDPPGYFKSSAYSGLLSGHSKPPFARCNRLRLGL